MTREDKDLLLKDLCARLPYGVKLGFYASATKQTYICTLLGLDPQEDEPVIAKTENGSFYMLAGNVKPYLFPLSSMTEEQYDEMEKIVSDDYLENIQITKEMIEKVDFITHFPIYCPNLIEWFHKNHFDYRGLIEKGLAIDATDKNIY